MKIYQIYPMSKGFSSKSIDYDGTAYYIAATSIKQAYYFGYQSQWASTPGGAGIIDIYTRGGTASGEGWHQLWDGCRAHGFHLSHGDGVRKITAAMQKHLDEEH